MEYEFIQSIGNAIDNVYSNSSENGSRKTTAKLIDNKMLLTYMTIINTARESDIHYQMRDLKKESTVMIRERLDSIKKQFKESSGRTLKAKKCEEYDNIETLTVSPYSPHRSLKISYTVVYEVA